MKEIPSPTTERVMRLLSVGKNELVTHQGFREWVIANHKERVPHGPRAPGMTGWQYQVPFWTKNALPCAEQFTGYTHFVEDTSLIDDATGLTLMHGYWCHGHNGNNANNTYTVEDFVPGKLRDGVTDEMIRNATIAVKFYFYGKTQPQVKSGYRSDLRLVIASLALRVEHDELVCLPVNIDSNLYFIGGHGSETRADKTHRIYTRGVGWQHHLRHSDWSAFRSSETQDEIARAKYRHAKILRTLLPALGN